VDKKVGLIILDGWGHGDHSKSDAIYNAKTPFMDSLYTKYANSELITFGEDVGLPEGQMGNSEVGHMNIGAGRVVYQELTRINKAIREKTFFENQVLKNALQTAKDKGVALHFMGLVSKGGVHSSQEHLYALCDMADDYGIEKSYIHAFTDGRDCDPKSGLRFISELETRLASSKSAIQVATVCGRYFAMDRDTRWERVKQAYDLLVHGTGEISENASKAISDSYANGVTDEFITPKIIQQEGLIKDGDVVICFNFRTDRCREITEALTQSDNHEYNMHKLDLHYCTMTNYDEKFIGLHVIYDKDNLKNTLGEVVSSNGKTQVRIAETEKYPHVTFFFSGGQEKNFSGEHRLLVNSPQVATYDLQPEMSALEVRDAIINDIKTKHPDFICLNFANPDMVGHTGVYSAIQKAVETVDDCLKRVIEAGQEEGYSFIVIADHGNADFALNADGSPNTAHSLNPVPFIVVKEGVKAVQSGILADVAPTIIELMGLEQPAEMTGKSLLVL
jgi:2,3-bisphosphoglycerate-independent phosphoglycerate mutase